MEKWLKIGKTKAKKIDFLDNHYIDKRGNIFSTYRIKKIIKVKPYLTDKGYYRIHLYRKGAHLNLHVHKLVLYTFIGPPPKNKPLGLHKNGNRKDNRLCNLYYGNQKENIADAIAHGRIMGVGSGVVFSNKRWMAQITFNGKYIYLGRYQNKKIAENVYKKVSKAFIYSLKNESKYKTRGHIA